MKCGIVTLIKNEHDYLDEWLIYNINKGFDKIIIFEDIDSITHINICNKYKNVELHSILEIDTYENLYNSFRQTPLYLYITNNINKWNLDWCLFCDIDEFIIGNFNDIHEVIEWSIKNLYNQIRLFWQIATCSNYAYMPNIPYHLQDIYTDIISDLDEVANAVDWINRGKFMQKSFINLYLFKKWQNIPHNPIVNDKYTIIGNKYKYKKYDFSDIFGYNTPFNLYLIHYMTKSYEEFVKIKLQKELANFGKFDKNKPNPIGRNIQFFKNINKKFYNNTTFNNEIKDINEKYKINI